MESGQEMTRTTVAMRDIQVGVTCACSQAFSSIVRRGTRGVEGGAMFRYRIEEQTMKELLVKVVAEFEVLGRITHR